MKQVAIVAMGLLLAPALAWADARDDAIDAMIKCASIADKAARSDCFDAAIPQLRAAAQTPPAPQVASAPPVAPVAPAPTAAPATTAMQDRSIFDSLNPFGGSGGGDSKPSPQQMAYQQMGAEVLPITIGVAAFGINPGGGFEVTLENGQVWQEHARDYDIPPFRSDRRNVVVIDHAMLGGYNLSLLGYARLYKIVRVR
jgi:hypothetical protein